MEVARANSGASNFQLRGRMCRMPCGVRGLMTGAIRLPGRNRRLNQSLPCPLPYLGFSGVFHRDVPVCCLVVNENMYWFQATIYCYCSQCACALTITVLTSQ